MGEGDRILVHGIQFYGHGGVHTEERTIGQRYAVDVEVVLDLSKAGRSDSLADTISYSDIYRVVIEAGESSRFHLIEALAEMIATMILQRFPVGEVMVRVKKLNPPIAGVLDYVGVEVVRRRGDGEMR
jgi:dihydroneopterin aldolase